MAAVFVPSQSPVGGGLERRNSIIDYAFSRYHYIITPREAEEIVNRSYWENVDAFCSYMIAANFGQPIPGTKNVELPSTITLYTDEEVDAIAESSNTQRPFNDRPIINDDSGAIEEDILVDQSYVEDAPHHTYITHEDLEFEDVVDEAKFDDEYLPPYTPEILPPYSPYDPMNSSSQFSLVIQAEKPEDDPPAYSDLFGTPEESAPSEVDAETTAKDICDSGKAKNAVRNDSIETGDREVYRTSTLGMLRRLGSGARHKLQKLAHAVSPKTVIRIREIKKRIRQKKEYLCDNEHFLC
ncbi:hypothetical protein Hte_001975 [Hypoxylon texense]